MLKKAKDSLLFILIAAMILTISVVSLILPDKTFSENENKMLAQLPSPSFKTLLNGDFASDYEEYVADQFWMRDEWIAAKSIAEYALLKTENNGVAYGKDGYMFQKYTSLNETRLRANLEAIRLFSDRLDCDLNMLIVPSSYSVLTNKLPAGLPGVDQAYWLEQVSQNLQGSAGFVELLPVLQTHQDSYIYYRTDHHWTTYGAYLAYAAYAESVGLTPIDYDALEGTEVEGFLGTSYSKCKAFNAQPDTITYFPELECVSLVNNGEEHDTLYNLEQFEKRDKYAAFLFGNSSLVEIETEYSEEKRDSILIIRDSYADSLVPYLTAHYNKIVLLDPRYYNLPFSELADDGYTDALILMGFENLAGEQGIAKLGL